MKQLLLLALLAPLSYQATAQQPAQLSPAARPPAIGLNASRYSSRRLPVLLANTGFGLSHLAGSRFAATGYPTLSAANDLRLPAQQPGKRLSPQTVRTINRLTPFL